MESFWLLKELGNIISLHDETEKRNKLEKLKISCEQHLHARKSEKFKGNVKSEKLVECNIALLQFPDIEKIRANGKRPFRYLFRKFLAFLSPEDVTLDSSG